MLEVGGMGLLGTMQYFMWWWNSTTSTILHVWWTMRRRKGASSTMVSGPLSPRLRMWSFLVFILPVLFVQHGLHGRLIRPARSHVAKATRRNTGHVLTVKLVKKAARAMHVTSPHATLDLSVRPGTTGVRGPSVASPAVNHKWSDAANVQTESRAMSAARVMMLRPRSVSGPIPSAPHGRPGQISHHARFVARLKYSKTK